MKLLIATRNPGKLAEIKAQMQNPSLEIVSLNDREVDDSSFIEDGATFAENALKKARFYTHATRIAIKFLFQTTWFRYSLCRHEYERKSRV